MATQVRAAAWYQFQACSPACSSSKIRIDFLTRATVPVTTTVASVKRDGRLKAFRAFRAVKDQSLTALNTSHFTDVLEYTRE
jgi:hypothetical protein